MTPNGAEKEPNVAQRRRKGPEGDARTPLKSFLFFSLVRFPAPGAQGPPPKPHLEQPQRVARELVLEVFWINLLLQTFTLLNSEGFE